MTATASYYLTQAFPSRLRYWVLLPGDGIYFGIYFSSTTYVPLAHK